LGSDGKIREAGWDFRNTKEMNIEKANGPILGIAWFNTFRWKQYDYYAYSCDKFVAQVYLVDTGFSNYVFLKYFDFETKEGQRTFDKSWYIFNSQSKALMPATHNTNSSYKADYTHGDIHFESIDSTGNGRKIRFDGNGISLELEFEINKFDGDKMIDVLTMNTDNTTWFYNEKYYNIPSSISLKLPNKEVVHSGGISVIDIGRGFFNYHNDMLWVSGGLSSKTSKVSFTFQQGFSTSESRRSQPNYFFVGEEGTQLHPVKFRVDLGNFNNDMSFETADRALLESGAPGTCQVQFIPQGDLTEEDNMYVMFLRITHVYGHFSGYCVDKNGARHDLAGSTGTFEQFYAQW